MSASSGAQKLSGATPNQSRQSTGNMSESIVRTTDEAKKYLIKKNYINTEETISSLTIAQLIRQVAEKLKSQTEQTNILVAIAFLAEKMETDVAIAQFEAGASKILDQLATDTKEKIDKAITSASNHLNALSDSYNNITLAANEATRVINDASQGLDNATQQAKENAMSYRDAVSNPSSKPSTRTAGPIPTPDNARQMQVVNHLAIQARQILVKPSNTTLPDKRDPTNEEMTKIRERMREAIEKAEKPEGLTARLRTISVTKGRLLLVEVQSPEAQKWLTASQNTEKWLKAFDTSASIVQQTFVVIAKFVPTTWQPNEDNELRIIEDDYELPPNSITAASWIKDPKNRREGQEVATAKINCATDDAANRLILGPISIAGKLVQIHKETRNPAVCGRCQQYGHFVATCPASQDICGKCGEGHRTNTCKEAVKKKCTPCGVNGHSTNDPTCPIATRKFNAMYNTTPTNASRFYPTPEERWTWDDNAKPPSKPWMALSRIIPNKKKGKDTTTTQIGAQRGREPPRFPATRTQRQNDNYGTSTTTQPHPPPPATGPNGIPVSTADQNPNQEQIRRRLAKYAYVPPQQAQQPQQNPWMYPVPNPAYGNPTSSPTRAIIKRQ